MGRWKSWVALGAAVVGLSGCWPAPGAGPDRQSFNGLEQAITVDNVDTLTEAWSVHEIGGTPNPFGRWEAEVGSPVVSPRGVLVVATSTSMLGFDPRTGTERWYQNLWGTDGLDATSLQLTDDGRALVGFGSGHRSGISVTGFDSATGAPAPRPLAGLADSVRGPWLASTSSREGPTTFRYHTTVRVLRLDDPTVAWEGWLDANAEAFWTTHMTLSDDRVLYAGQGLTAPAAGTFGNGLRSFPVADGTSDCGPVDEPYYACPHWVVPIDGTRGTPPVLSTDQATAYVATDAGTVYAVDTATGAVEWSAAVGAGVVQTPALAYGTLFVPTEDGRLVAVDAATGAVEWSTVGASELTVQPAVAGGVVFTGAADGTVAAYDAHGCGAATCAELWSGDAGSRITGAPAISLGKVFVGTEGGRLIAYGPSTS
jgi:outer membrane protein assembly factor BamB